MAGVRNLLKTLCGQEQAESRAEINPTLQIWGHLVVFIHKKKTLNTQLSFHAYNTAKMSSCLSYLLFISRILIVLIAHASLLMGKFIQYQAISHKK